MLIGQCNFWYFCRKPVFSFSGDSFASSLCLTNDIMHISRRGEGGGGGGGDYPPLLPHGKSKSCRVP